MTKRRSNHVPLRGATPRLVITTRGRRVRAAFVVAILIVAAFVVYGEATILDHLYR